MPYCDWQLEKANTIWCTPQEAPYNELPLVPIDFSAKLMKQSIYEADYNHEHLQNIVDNLNLLYVAFTRASHNLIVIGKRANSAYRSAIIESVLDKVASRLEAKKTDDGDYLLSARLEIDKVNDMFGLELPESDEYMTVGGLILHEYQSFPKLNEVIKFDNFEFKIIKSTSRKIELVKLHIIK